uniref:Uncharacterized protein n=1 Tax=Anguilla anguilla TaxID=7936 RepID=A0A0E9UEU2_ANGAN
MKKEQGFSDFTWHLGFVGSNA